MIFSIAFHYLLYRKQQMIIAVLGVMLGVGFFIGISGMMQGMHTYLTQKLVDTAPHIKITDEFRNPHMQPLEQTYPDALRVLHGLQPKQETRGIRNALRMAGALREMKGVEVSPVLQGNVFFRFGGKDFASSIVGIDPAREKTASNVERDMQQGTLDNLLSNPNGVIIGVGLADRMQARYGDRLNVTSAAGIVRQMKIVGIFETGDTLTDNRISYAVLKKVQILENKPDTVNQINLRIKDVDAAPQMAQEIEARFKYKAESWQEAFASVFQLFRVQDTIMYSTVTTILMVAGFGIYNIISTSVNEKSKDIAILKSMGFSQGDLIGIFLVQGILIGVVGMIMGFGLGAILLEAISKIDMNFGKVAVVKMQGFPVFRSPWLFAGAGALALFSAMLSAIIPARRAARLHPVDIIRGASG